MTEPGDRRHGERRHAERRHAATLADDPAWQQLVESLGQKVDRVVRRHRRADDRDSVAAAAAAAGLSDSGVEDLVNGQTDPKLSTLHLLAKANGFRVYVFFEPA